MIDYGLVAYNRSEESIRQNLKIKYDSNFIRYFYFILSNTKTEVAKVKTSKQTLVKLKLTCNTDCVCEVYVNNNIEYAFNVVDSAECYLKLDGECKIELKLKKSTNVMIKTSLLLFRYKFCVWTCEFSLTTWRFHVEFPRVPNQLLVFHPSVSPCI